MRRAGGAALLVAGLLLAGCTGSPEPTPSITVTPDAGACPGGTTQHDEFCFSDDPLAEDLAAIVRNVYQADGLGAVIAGVWHDGDPVMIGALGESLPGVPATPDMHHLLGNLTTPMYATTVLQQVDQGVLGLDDPVSKWFPEIAGADQVTVRMLLQNTAGYTQFTDTPGFLADLYEDPFQDFQPEDVIPYGVGSGPNWTPGTDWGFSDTNTLILIEIVEKATGRPFSELLHEGVLDPLGMTNTTTALLGEWPQPVLHGFSNERGVWEDVTSWSPSWASFAGGLGSNQDDIRVFLDALGSGELLSPESHELQLAPSLSGIGFNTDKQYWGMGTLVVNGWTFMNPGLPGYFGAGGTFPDEGWTIVVYNTTGRTGDQSKASATDIFREFTAILTPDNAFEQR